MTRCTRLIALLFLAISLVSFLGDRSTLAQIGDHKSNTGQTEVVFTYAVSCDKIKVDLVWSNLPVGGSLKFTLTDESTYFLIPITKLEPRTGGKTLELENQNGNTSGWQADLIAQGGVFGTFIFIDNSAFDGPCDRGFVIR